MSRWGIGAAVAAASALILTGCTSAPAPVAPTTSEIIAYSQKMLDETRTNNDLSDLTPRVIVDELPNSTQSNDDWYQSFNACLVDGGILDAGLSYGPDGYQMFGATETPYTREQNLVLYKCAALHPYNALGGGLIFSDSQKTYLWHYYSQRVMPCLAMAGAQLYLTPSKKEFFAAAGGQLWDPYPYLIVPTKNIELAKTDGTIEFLSDAQRKTFEKECGPARGGLAEPSDD